MQIEVGFDPCQMTHYDARDCVAFGDGLLYIALATVVLLAMMPRVMRPFLTMIGDAEAEDSLCVPEGREKFLFGVTATVALLATLWWLSPRSDEPVISRLLSPLGQSLTGTLGLTALGAAVTMSLSLSQRTMDRIFGKSLAALVGLAILLSGLVVVAIGQQVAWLIVWWSAFLLAGTLVRSVRRVTWEITRVISAFGATVVVLQAAKIVVDALA